MNTYRFSLEKVTRWSPRFSKREKVVFVDAPNLDSAYARIICEWSGWNISMFWLVW